MVGCGDSPVHQKVFIDYPAKPAVEDKVSLFGKYASECVDFGGGQNTKLIAELTEEYEVKLVMFVYVNVGCTGSVSVVDLDGNPATATKHEQDMEVLDLDCGKDVYAIKVTDIDTLVPAYALVYVTDAQLYELAGMSSEPVDCTSDSEIASFVIDPINYVSNVYLSLHFYRL